MMQYLQELKRGQALDKAADTDQAWVIRANKVKKPKNAYRRKEKGLGKWREAVLLRADFTCMVCGDMNRLEAHHIESYHSTPSLRVDIDNGVCLCHKCHKRFHKWFGNRDNTEKQWRIFYDEGIWLR